MPAPFHLNYQQMAQAQAALPDRFGLLGLFPAGYSCTWAEVCALWDAASVGFGEIRRSLEFLRAWHIVEHVPGTDRIYRLPEVVRQLALDYLVARPAVRALGEQRLIGYYAAFAAIHTGDRPEHISRIADVYEAAGAALDWAELGGRWADVAVLARALCRFCYARRLDNQYRAGLRRGLAAAQQADHPREEAWFLREQAGLAADGAGFANAVRLFERSIALYRRLGDARGEAQVLYEWGQAESAQSHYETARHLVNESLDIMRELQHGVLQPTALHELADLSLKQGLTDQAAHELLEALNAEGDRGDRVAQAHTLYELGELAANRGQGAEARALYLRSLALAHQEHDSRQGGRTLAALGLLAALGNETTTATHLWLAALALLRAAEAPEAGEVDRALDRHLGTARGFLLPETTGRALAEWWRE